MEEQRKKILIAAGKEMMARGVRVVTMDEIAAQVGMSKKTIYTYFKGKDEIVEAIFAAHFDSQWGKVSGEGGGLIDRLLQLMSLEVRQHHSVCPQFLEDLRRYYPALLSDFLQRRREYVRRELDRLLLSGEEEGTIRGDIDREVIVDILTDFPSMLLYNDRIAALGYSVARMRSAVQELLLGGLLTDEGRSREQTLRAEQKSKGDKNSN